MNLKNLALIPVVTLVASIFATLFLNLSEKLAFNPPYLLLALNLIFWTTATLAIAFISAKSFLKEDSSIVLIISCAIIIFALPVIISGWVQTFSVNESIALSNPCILVASILQLIGSILAFQGKQETKTSNRKRLLATAYLASVILVLANLTVALLGYYPPFFAATGPTLLRQVVLGSAVFFFAVAAIVFGVQYLRAKSPSLYWYAFAIGLFSIGLFSAFEQKSIGDVPTWLGRITLYVGTLYLTAAILSTKKEAKGTDRASAWAESFRSNPQQLTNFFSRMFDAFTYCKILTSKDGKPVDYVFLDVNEAAVNVIGLKKNEVLGKKASEIMKIDALEDWLAIVGPVALNGEPITLDHLSKFTGRWVHVSVYSPQKSYFVSISEDITNRKKAEEAVTYQANLLSRAHEAIFGIDSQYNIAYWNKGAEAIFGWSKEEVMGKNSGDLLQTKIDGSSRSEQVNRLLASGQWQGEAHYLRKDGSYVLVEINAATLTGPNGELQGIVTAARDITERKKAEEALKQQKAVAQQERDRLSSLLNSITDEVWFADTEKKFTLANPSAVKEFKLDSFAQGVDVENLAESLEVLRPDGSPRPVEEAPPLRALKGEIIKNQEEVIRTPASGELKTRQVSSAPVKDNKGNIIGSVSVVRDITELKQLQNRLQKYHRRFGEAC